MPTGALSSSSSGTTKSLLGTGGKSCVNCGTLFFFATLLADPAPRWADALSAGDEAGSLLFAADGVDGEDF